MSEISARHAEQRIRELTHENTQLRKRLGERGRHAGRVRRAYSDALLLAQWRAVGIMPSREFARRHGMTQRRWQNAVGLLRMARVITDYRRWQITELATIEQRLELARERAIETPASYHARLVAHAKNGKR